MVYSSTVIDIASDEHPPIAVAHTSPPTEDRTSTDTEEIPEQQLDAKDPSHPNETTPVKPHLGSGETDKGESSISGSFKDLEKGAYDPTFYSAPSVTPPREHFRDIDFLGPFTLHRLLVLLWVGGSGTLFFYIQEWIFPEISEQTAVNQWHGWPYIGIIWLVSLPASIAGFAGFLWFRYFTKIDKVQPTTYNVAFRIVSRGLNAECLMETIKQCQLEMARTPLFPYLIEVVTDADVFEAPPDPDVIQLKVPPTYHTPRGTLFKARALHYACEHSTVPPTTWIVHLDEETRPTSSGIKGIAAMVAECERTGDVKRVGQGPIVYHRSFEKYPFLTLADMRRTGDDMGHYYLQHRIGFTLFGLHGAYIVCRQDAEASIGFDVGPDGSITEDAWWVLLAMKEGYRTKWVDGYLAEQSTQSIADFLKQRRRWYYGLSKVVLYCPVSFKYRLFIFLNTVSWLLAPLLLPFQLAYMILLYHFDLPVAVSIRILTNFIVAISILVYFGGLVANLREHGTRWWKIPAWMLAMLIALPFCMALELVSVVMAFFAPFSTRGKGFHVVQKSRTAESEESSSEDSSE